MAQRDVTCEKVTGPQDRVSNLGAVKNSKCVAGVVTESTQPLSFLPAAAVNAMAEDSASHLLPLFLQLFIDYVTNCSLHKQSVEGTW